MKKSFLVVCTVLSLILTSCGANTAQPLEKRPSSNQTVTQAPASSSLMATPLSEAAPSLSPYDMLATPEANPASYFLVNQTADLAHESLMRIEQILIASGDNLKRDEMDFPAYYRAAWYVAWDASVRFPSDPRAEIWRWKMAYYMALSGDVDESIQAYNSLITNALNSKKISVDDLPNQVLLGNTQNSLFTPSFVIEIEKIAIPGIDQGYVLHVGSPDPDTPIAACFLITKNSDRYSTYFIEHSFIDFGYNTMSRDSVSCTPRDVTNDGIDEIITEQYRGGHNGYYTVRVFDTTSLPPKAMSFESAQGKTINAQHSYLYDYPEVDRKTQIQFYTSIGLLNCQNAQIENYQWNGKIFELASRKLDLLSEQSDRKGLSYCADNLISYGLYNQTAKDAASFLEEVIQIYRPYAAEVGDIFNEIRLRLGLYYALQGDMQKARATIVDVVQNPVVKDSVWVEPAVKFLELYKHPNYLYRASTVLISCTPYRELDSASGTCQKIPIYDNQDTLDYILNVAYPSTPISQVADKLKESGVNIAAEGWFDFDQDRKNELWFTILNPWHEDEFKLWIVAESGNRKIIFDAGFFEPNVAEPTFRIEHNSKYPFIIGLTDYNKFELIRDENGDPSINWLDVENLDDQKSVIADDLKKFRELRQLLISNSEDSSIYDQVVKIYQKHPRCPFTTDDYFNLDTNYDCASFYYTLAYSAELAGRPEDAVALYHKTWLEYPNSPFAILAQQKLGK